MKKRKPLKKRKPEERLAGKSVVDIIEPKDAAAEVDKESKKRDKVDKNKVVKETYEFDAKATNEVLLKKYYSDSAVKMPSGFKVEVKNYKWSSVKGIGDYVGPGVFRAIDPALKYTDYPANYLTDPITKTVLQRVKSYDKFCFDNCIMFKAKRVGYLKELGESARTKDVKLLEKHRANNVSEVEYYGVFNQTHFVYAVSYGQDGQTSPWG